MTDMQTEVVTEETYRDRAGRLARMLAAAPYRHNQGTWGGVREQNECGTAACAAGWSLLAGRGIVTIDPDGTMSYDKAALGAEEPRSWYPSDVQYQRAIRIEHTLWRDEYAILAESEGKTWLGLSYLAASSLFVITTYCDRPEAAAVAVLRRIGDGRLGTMEDGRLHFHLFAMEMDQMAKADFPSADDEG